MFQWKVFRSKWLAIGWFILMCFLFFLPGSDLPTDGFFARIPHFDKIVHVSLFAMFIFLWSSAFDFNLPAGSWKLLLIALLYGFSIEVIQKEWVKDRTFDLFDVVADMTGAIAGLLFWLAVYKKNKPL